MWITPTLQSDLCQDFLLAMQMVQLQQKIGTSEDRILFLETSEQRLKNCVSQLERSLEVMQASPDSPAVLDQCSFLHIAWGEFLNPEQMTTSHFAVPLQLAQQHLKVAKDEVSTKEQEFHRELATARKLAQLYKEADGEKGKKVTELEGIITELQKHLKVALDLA